MKTDLQTKQTTKQEVSVASIQTTLDNIENLILNIRDKQVMLDRDLARLYGVETKRLNEAVKRNIERFPEDFMFQLSHEEFESRAELYHVLMDLEEFLLYKKRFVEEIDETQFRIYWQKEILEK